VIRDLQDLWILKEGGVVVFSKKNNKSINDQFIGGFISALSSFTKVILNDILSHFATHNLQVKILSKEGFMFVGRFPKKIKDKQVKKELDYIVSKFFEYFPQDQINKFGTDMKYYQKFEDILTHNYETLTDYISYIWNNKTNE